MKYIILAICISVLFIPTAPTNPQPVTPPAPTVQRDTLDECHDIYRQLMHEAWSEYADKRASMSDEDALKWINTRQVAAFTAAYDKIQKKSAEAAAPGGPAKAFADAWKNHSL